MRAGEARLAIDCGIASTAAVLAWPDGTWLPLMFDGEPALPSAVLVGGDGDVLTGHQAWQAAAADPQRFIPAPRRSPEQQLAVAGADVDTLDLVAATLRRVAAEAQRAVGSVVEDVRLVVPAGWGPRRRTWMRHAAHRAGLPEPRLIEAPVAVAGHLLATGVQVPVGSYIVVCDVGAGAEVSVLRRGPAGFEVLATLVAARQWRIPHGGWSQLLAFPTGSVVTAGLGMMLIQYSLTADRWPHMVLWIDLASRLGGLFLGVGTVMAVVSQPILRLILGAPLAVITAALVGWPASGILGAMYAIAVAAWWLRQLWTRLLRPAAPAAR